MLIYLTIPHLSSLFFIKKPSLNSACQHLRDTRLHRRRFKCPKGRSSESSFAYSVRIEPSRCPSSISSSPKRVSTRRFDSTTATRMRGAFKIGIACVLISSRSPSALSCDIPFGHNPTSASKMIPNISGAYPQTVQYVSHPQKNDEPGQIRA